MQKNESNTFNEAVLALEKLVIKQKPLTSTALKSFIIALFTADNENPLRYSGTIGLLQLDIDRSLKSHFLRLYDIETLKILVELELYYGFGNNYRKYGKPTLYIFDFFDNGVIGFEFRN